ncbi:MAG: hypothetical protein BAJATHORv1_10482 [Candidatus Thorarchaeota archaeon]|nr:MAG: hypothetical protein BAJATHORv1_10482 [Candidatus Thorarchaeota archaeon]
MDLIEKLLNLFNRRGKLFSGTINQPNDLMKSIQVVRAYAFQKITGKRLVIPTLESNHSKSIAESLSPMKRLARRDI